MITLDWDRKQCGTKGSCMAVVPSQPHSSTALLTPSSSPSPTSPTFHAKNDGNQRPETVTLYKNGWHRQADQRYCNSLLKVRKTHPEASEKVVSLNELLGCVKLNKTENLDYLKCKTKGGFNYILRYRSTQTT